MFQKLLLSVTVAVAICGFYGVNRKPVVDSFGIAKGERVTVWIEAGDTLLYNGRVVFESQQGTELVLEIPGNYKILMNK